MAWEQPIHYLASLASGDTSTLIVYITIGMIFCVAIVDTRDREDRESARERAEMASPDYPAILARRQMERAQRIRALARRAAAREAAREAASPSNNSNAAANERPRVSMARWSRFIYRPLGTEEEGVVCDDVVEAGGGAPPSLLQEDGKLSASALKEMLMDGGVPMKKKKGYERANSVDSSEIYVEMNESCYQVDHADDEEEVTFSPRSTALGFSLDIEALDIEALEEGKVNEDGQIFIKQCAVSDNQYITLHGEEEEKEEEEGYCEKKAAAAASSLRCESLVAEKVAARRQHSERTLMLMKTCGDVAQCSICLEEYEAGDAMVQLPCNHVYHDECVSLWVSSHIRCPLCNYDLVADEPADDNDGDNNTAQQQEAAAPPPPAAAGAQVAMEVV